MGREYLRECLQQPPMQGTLPIETVPTSTVQALQGTLVLGES